MARSGVPSSFSDDSTNIFYAVEFAFDDGFVRLWTGYGNITIESNTYYGLGKCLSISAITETQELTATGITIGVSGITSNDEGDSDLISDAMSKDLQGRKVKCLIGTLDGSRVASTYVIFSGTVNTLQIKDTVEESIVIVRCDSKLVDFNRPRTLRYTDNEQQWLYPAGRASNGAIVQADRIFDQLGMIINKKIDWKPD